MLLRFENTVADMVAFNRYYLTRSPFFRAFKIIALVGGSAVIVGRMLTSPLAGDETRLVAVITGFVMAAIYWVVIVLTIRLVTSATVRLMIREGKNKGILGQHEIEIDSQGLVERTEVNESRYTWRGVERIAETDDHVFIFIGTLMAHVIPKRAITVGDPVVFLARANEWWRAANPESSS